MTLQGLADGSVKMKTFLTARKLSDFEEWLKKQNKPKEEVEYFE